ncbi:MAG: hypothetical protein H7839_17810, partial [Magnetococcus sp. YQC-5]
YICVGLLLLIITTSFTFFINLLKNMNIHKLLFMIIFPPISALALYFSMATYTSNLYYNLFLPEYFLLNSPPVDTDTYLHTAITSMIQKYGVPSLGLDGIKPVAYHVGSHYWFAALGSMIGSMPTHTIPFSMFIIVLPFFFWCGWNVTSVLRIYKNGQEILHIVLTVLIFWLITNYYLKYLLSESFVMATSLFLLLLPIIIRIFNENDTANTSLLLYIILLVFIFIISSVKLSAGIMVAVLVVYALWRSLKNLFLFSIILSAVACVSIYSLWLFRLRSNASTANIDDNVSLLTTLKVYFYKSSAYYTFFENPPASIVALLPFFLFIVLLLFDSKPVSTETHSTRMQFLPKKLTENEIIFVITWIGVIPALLGVIPFGNDFWFYNHAQVISIFFLLSKIRIDPQYLSKLYSIVALRIKFLISQSIAGLLIVIFLISIPIYVHNQQLLNSIKSFYWTLRGNFLYNNHLTLSLILLREASAHNHEFLKGRTVEQYVSDSINKGHGLFGTEGYQAIQEMDFARSITFIRKIAEERGKGVGVFIPPENTVFWEMSKKRGCEIPSYVIPSLTGTPMIAGIPPLGVPCRSTLLDMTFDSEIRSRSLSDEALCAHALKRDIHHILILQRIDKPEDSRILQCIAPVDG